MTEKSGEEKEREEKATTRGTELDDCETEHHTVRSTHPSQDCIPPNHLCQTITWVPSTYPHRPPRQHRSRKSFRCATSVPMGDMQIVVCRRARKGCEPRVICILYIAACQRTISARGLWQKTMDYTGRRGRTSSD